MFTIFSKIGCVFCHRAASHLRQIGANFDVIRFETLHGKNHHDYSKAREESAITTFPLITYRDIEGTVTVIGGHDDLVKYTKDVVPHENH